MTLIYCATHCNRRYSKQCCFPEWDQFQTKSETFVLIRFFMFYQKLEVNLACQQTIKKCLAHPQNLFEQALKPEQGGDIPITFGEESEMINRSLSPWNRKRVGLGRMQTTIMQQSGNEVQTHCNHAGWEISVDNPPRELISLYPPLPQFRKTRSCARTKSQVVRC